MSGVSQNIDRLEVVFDDEGLVADGGLLAAGVLMDRLGLEELVDKWVRLGGRVGGANPGRKTLTLVASMLVGVLILIMWIGSGPVLRSGCCLFGVAAPSTVGTFLRSFSWGHVLQLGGVMCSSWVRRLKRRWVGRGEQVWGLGMGS